MTFAPCGCAGWGTFRAVAVLVAGCGYVGSVAAELLCAGGDTVYGARRHPEADDASRVRPLAVDFSDAGAAVAKLSSLAIDRMIYLVSPDGRSDEAYQTAYVRGLANAIAALPTLRRAVLVSSTGVYDAIHDGRWVDEETPVRGEGFAARRLAQGEALLHQRVPESIVLRLGGIYGPGRTRMVTSVLEKEATAPAIQRFSNRIHRDDAARAAVHLLQLPRPAPLYIGVDCDPAPIREVQQWIAQRAGVASPPPSPDRALVRGSKRCRSARLQGSGFTFQYPSYRDGYREIVDALSA